MSHIQVHDLDPKVVVKSNEPRAPLWKQDTQSGLRWDMEPATKVLLLTCSFLDKCCLNISPSETLKC